MAEIYNDQKLGADSMISVSEAVLKLHKDNKRALAFAADAYAEKKNEDKQIEALTRLISARPEQHAAADAGREHSRRQRQGVARTADRR